MSFLLGILVILSLALCTSYLFKKQFVLMLPVVTASISLTLYVFGVFGYRMVGFWAIIVVALVLILIVFYENILQRGQGLRFFYSPGFIYFCLITIFIFTITRGFVFMAWDEFSHWGIVLKNIFMTNGLGNLNSSTTIFKSYPQGVSLFANFFISFSRHFSESSAIRGILVLSFSQIAIIFANIKTRSYKIILPLTIISIIFPLVFFESFFSTIYVDAILGLVFGNILFFNYIYKKKDLFYSVYMSLQMYLLVNTKQIGIVLALIALSYILIDHIAANKYNRKRFMRIIFDKKLFFIMWPAAVSVLTWLSWKIYLMSNKILEYFDISSGPNHTSTLNILKGNLEEFQTRTVINFVNRFAEFGEFGALKISYLSWSIGLLLLAYLIFKLKVEKTKRPFSPNIVLFLGFYLYSGVLLFMYILLFGEYEGTRLASIERYIGSYLLGYFMFSLFVAIHEIVSSNRFRHYSSATLGVVLLVLLTVAPPTWPRSTVLHNADNIVRRHKRQEYDDINKFGSILAHKPGRVFVIDQNSNCFSFWVLRYSISPLQVQPAGIGCSFGAPYSQEDIWTKDIDSDGFLKILRDYDYVYLVNVDEQFKHEYGKMFKDFNCIGNGRLYEVIKGKTMQLKAVHV